MRALVEGIGSRFAALGGDLRTATLVDRVEPAERGRFAVVTRRRERLIARQVAFNLPLDLAARLLGRGLEGRLGRREAESRAVWSAFTGYVAFDRSAVADDAPLFHQVLRDYDRPIHDGNNVLVSLSPPGDEGYGPPDVRVATLSTHTAPGDWSGLDRAAYAGEEDGLPGPPARRAGQALPDAPARLVHAEFASPRSFARYTRRTARRGGRAAGLAGQQQPARRRLRRLRPRPLGRRRLGLSRPGDDGHRPLGGPGRREDHGAVVGGDARASKSVRAEYART